ncbi:AIR synthase-related protein [Lentisphaerota bacterium WC36G]|nr:phosphoribosylformylglycinamidine synthase [Lentisphaerae bacterium WC36]
MEYRIEISPQSNWRDSRGEKVKEQLATFFDITVDSVKTRDVYTVSADITAEEAQLVAKELTNPVLQNGLVGESKVDGDWIVAVGFKPGVTDNVGRSAHEAIGDIIGRKLDRKEKVFSSVEYIFTAASLKREDVENIAKNLLANQLIESIDIYSMDEVNINGLPLNLPIVKATGGGTVNEYDLEVSDEELIEISRKGVLALTLEEMQVIQNYFRKAEGREVVGLKANPTDVELEVLAQTWSEHCKHKIFAAEITYDNGEGKTEVIDSVYKKYVKGSTHKVAESVDWLVSVFHDNAGVISFNDKLDLVYKVETHNSPSALDPYGGAMTGIVGVNRDPMGTGQGANLLINVWGYCLGSPFTANEDVPEGLLHPRRLRDGVHKGVIDGGNQSGIPYGLGWEYFDERFLGKPLVYCGTVGTLPKKIGETREGWTKEINPGDLIVMAGGRIGKDGIHGATFSSEELHNESPVAAVQIGDPITQKKVGDFIYDARDRQLYRFVTDNGAGGLSSSIGEMAELCGGCRMDLAKAPLKYAGLEPWEILVSEAQERMSFAVPPENIDEFIKLAESRDVEVTVLGEFTDTGKFHMMYNDDTVAYLDIEFMHDGLPQMKLNAKWEQKTFSEVDPKSTDVKADVLSVVGGLNICSNEYKARQYDHEVKGLSVVKPFIGVKRDVVSDATVSMIEPMSEEGVILSAGILPRYSDIDTYHMMSSCIDLAVRRIIAVGGDMSMIAGLDNFCWPDPVQSDKTPDGEYKLAQLVRANQAIYDYTTAYKVPCISGKDSMKNDSTLGGRKISIPPTVLFSAISKISNISSSLTLETKKSGDIVYIIGDTKAELGASEYFALKGGLGNNVPKVDIDSSLNTYNTVAKITANKLAASLHTPALGGLVVGFAKKAVAGDLGLDIDLSQLPVLEEKLIFEEKLFSESNGRFIMTVAPENKSQVEDILSSNKVSFAEVGKVIEEKVVKISDADGSKVELTVDELATAYKSTLEKV